MTKINKQKPVETVQEANEKQVMIKKSSLSTSARSKAINKSGSNLQSGKESYGPCRGTLCGCSCSSYTCTCTSSSIQFEKWGPGIKTSGRIGEDDIDPEDELREKITKGALKYAGRSKIEVSGQVSGSVFGYKDDKGELKVLSGTAGGEINSKGIKGKLSAYLCNMKAGRVQVRAGIAADTGISAENGLEVKAVGFGFSVGKQTGISTPFGEVKVDTEDCIIQ